MLSCLPQALLNNLVYKSALMQDKKFEPLQLLSNRDSVVHSMAGSAFLDQAFTNGETCFSKSGL
jgi:hypothetical protein